MPQMRVFRTLFVVLFAGLSMACGGLTNPSLDVAQAEELWQERSPTEYSMVVQRSCECLPEATGPVRVTVRGQEVDREYVASGEVVGEDFAHAFPTVPEFFALIHEAYASDTFVQASYHPDLGYPTSLILGEGHPDIRITYSVEDFN